MLLSFTSIFELLTVFSFFTITKACKAPPGTNFTVAPGYWCNLEARVSITTICDYEVEEEITVPWTTRTVSRFVPTDNIQKIENLVAYRILQGRRISTYSSIRQYRPPGNAVLAVQVPPSREPMTVLIKYKKTAAVQIFSQCSGIGDFKEVNPSLDNSLMISKWAVGGRSATEMLRVGVSFVLPRHQTLQYVDTVTTAPTTFKQVLNDQGNATDKPVRVIYSGSASGELPSELFFYIRFMMKFGVQSCPFSRSCGDEELIMNEGKSQSSNHKLILGLTLGLGFAIVITGIVAWVCCCKWIREKEPEPDGGGNVPDSLRHFNFDTDDEHHVKKKEEWTEANVKSSGFKEEVFALDLSPRNRRKKEGVIF